MIPTFSARRLFRSSWVDMALAFLQLGYRTPSYSSKEVLEAQLEVMISNLSMWVRKTHLFSESGLTHPRGSMSLWPHHKQNTGPQLRLNTISSQSDWKLTSPSGENVGQVQKEQASQIFFLSANSSPLLGAGKTRGVLSSSDPGLPA